MVLVAKRSDRTGRRAEFVARGAAVGIFGFATAAMVTDPIASLVALSIAALGIWGALGPFWAMPPAFLRGAAAAGGIAVINSVGNIGGFAGPYIVGAAREATGNFSAGLWVMAGCLAVGVVIAMGLARDERSSA